MSVHSLKIELLVQYLELNVQQATIYGDEWLYL